GAAAGRGGRPVGRAGGAGGGARPRRRDRPPAGRRGRRGRVGRRRGAGPHPGRADSRTGRRDGQAMGPGHTDRDRRAGRAAEAGSTGSTGSAGSAGSAQAGLPRPVQSGSSVPLRESRNFLKAATGGVSGRPASHATPISRAALGAVTVSSTTPGRGTAGGGSSATPRPAATSPRRVSASSPSNATRGRKPARLHRSSVMRRRP